MRISLSDDNENGVKGAKTRRDATNRPLDIIPVQTRKQWRDFHHLPFKIYRDDRNWVPPLLLERRFHFSQKHNPFFQHAQAAFWLAYQDGEPVGRISAQVDRLHLERC